MAESSSLLGQTVSHYRIIEKLGGGIGLIVIRFFDRNFENFRPIVNDG